MSSIIPYIVQIGQFLFALTIIVGIHEFGHFITAKWTGMRVEKFFIGFPPNIFSFKKGDTQYGIGIIFLGGFVKVTGIIDESFDSKTMKSSTPEPYEYRAKNPYQRLLFLSGGIIMNIILAIVIYTGITYSIGEMHIPKDEILKHGIHTSQVSKEVGFEEGDKIISVNGDDYNSYSDLISPNIYLEDKSYYDVQRKNDIVRIDLPGNILETLSTQNDKKPLFGVRRPYVIKDLASNGNAKEAGLLKGDKVLTVNGESTIYFQELTKVLSKYKGSEVILLVGRGGQEVTIKSKVSEDGKLGIIIEDKLRTVAKDYGFFSSIAIGSKRAFSVISTQIIAFKKMFKGEIDPTKSLAGPIRIVQNFSSHWDWYSTLNLTALLSMAIGFMNFLPIPALDGGHIVFTVYEIISGRKPSMKFLENAQKLGVAILLALMVFVFGNDIISFF